MSIMDVLKKDLGGKKKAAPETSTAVEPTTDGGDETPVAPPAAAKAIAKSAALVLSASPRADLLPPEIGANEKKRAVRRGLRLMVVAVVVIVVLAIGGAVSLAVVSATQVVDAQAETLRLTQQIATYNDVKVAEQALADGEAAVRVGGSTDIDWSDYLTRLQATLPSDVVISEVAIDSADALTTYPQSSIPLELARIGTISFTANTPVLPSIPSWIQGLSTLPGFADATPGSLTFSEGVYTATLTMHIDERAYSHEFAPVVEEASE